MPDTQTAAAAVGNINGDGRLGGGGGGRPGLSGIETPAAAQQTMPGYPFVLIIGAKIGQAGPMDIETAAEPPCQSLCQPAESIAGRKFVINQNQAACVLQH